MRIPSDKELERLRMRYPAGSRVRLLHMDDVQSPPEGTLGTVQGIDSMGDLEVSWDTGSNLKLIPGIDGFRLEK
ncbi:MAG: DUF4314 domain-containing protein [Sphaerochaetaceae bacterium]